MHIEQKLVECEPDDPNRCQAVGSGGEGQCRYLSLKGIIERKETVVQDPSLYKNALNCPKHGSAKQIQKEERKRVNQYRLQVWQERIHEFTESEQVKTLRDEIGILRFLLETMLNKCGSATELMIYSQKIGDLVMKIEKTVRSCDRLESNMGMLIDRAGALILAAKIVETITEHVKEPAIIDQISGGIIDAISNITSNE